MPIDASQQVQNEFDSALAHAHKAFSDIVEWLTPSSDQRRLAEVEEQLGQRLWALGLALLGLWLVHRRPRQVERTLRGPDGRWYRRLGIERRVVKSIFGPLRYVRDVYGIGRGKRGDTFAPLDRELGLQPSGFSLSCIIMATCLCAKMPFAEVASTLKRFWGWAPSTKALLDMVDKVGPLARRFLEAQPAPDDDGEILVLQVDGRGAPMISDTEMERRRRPHKKRPRGTSRWRRRKPGSPPRKRRRKGDKSKNAKVATVGVIYTLRRAPDGVVEGPIHKRVYATFGRAESLFQWLRTEADKRGYGTKRTLFLADGDLKLWEYQQRYFPLAECCVDWCHIVEKLWKLGRLLYGEDSPELGAWVHEQTKDLRKGQINAIIHRLDDIAADLQSPRNQAKRETLEKGIRYLANNAHRMPYDKLAADGLDIATGAAEGAVRQLVELRLDGPGMRWSPARAEYVLQLRCVVLNGLWDEFQRDVIEHAHAAGLRAQKPPHLGSTHNAEARCAA